MRFLGIADRIYRKKLPGNIVMELKPEEHIQQQLFWYGYYEKSLGSVLKNLLQPDSTFIDIGANIGYFSLLAARSAPEGKIVSFEPVSYLFETLQKNVAVNNIVNIRPVRAAVGEMNEDRLIYLSAEDNTGMSSFHKPENYSGKDEMVNVFAFDKWFADSGLAKIDIIKIDVEGNELAVLKGMKGVAELFRPHILLEVNPGTLSCFNLTPADIIKYAIELSYEPFVISEPGKLKRPDTAKINKTLNFALIHSAKLNTVNSYLF